MHAPHVMSGGRYPVLRALAILYVAGAGLVALAAVLVAAWTLFASGMAATDRLIMLAATLAGGFIAVITSLAVAELLKLFIDIEHNTRVAASARVGMAASAEVAASNGGDAVNRITALDEETAEVALIRGH